MGGRRVTTSPNLSGGITSALSGHATLASSKVIFEKNDGIDSIHFINIQNLDLMIRREDEKISMEFPVYDTEPAEAPVALRNALGIKEYVNSAYNQQTKILLLEIESSKVLQNLSPDFEALYGSHDSINGVLVTAPSSRQEFDFESRYFWPWSGTNEDPVTGGTHTFLTKYWSERLGKTKMNSFQRSKRTGFMEVELTENNKLRIKSTAQIVLEGQLQAI